MLRSMTVKAASKNSTLAHELVIGFLLFQSLLFFKYNGVAALLRWSDRHCLSVVGGIVSFGVALRIVILGLNHKGKTCRSEVFLIVEADR